MSTDPHESLEDMSNDDTDIDDSDGLNELEQEEEFEEMELPSPAEHTMVLDAVDLPPPPEEASWEDGPEDVLDDSELDATDPPSGEFGGPEDGSEEQPFLVVSEEEEEGSSSDEDALAGDQEDDASDADPEAAAADDDSKEAPRAEVSSATAKRLRETPLRGAYEYLTIRTPIAEFESYAGARTEALVRLGKTEDAEVAALAMRLGADALRRVMGALPKEAQ